MYLSAISSFFEPFVPFGVVFLVVYLVRMSWDIKYINEKLDNHITDTDKKVDALREDVKEVRKDIRDVRLEVKEVREDVKEVRAEVKDVREDVKEVREEVKEVREEVRSMDKKLDQLLSQAS